jgi:hypothetical protein
MSGAEVHAFVTGSLVEERCDRCNRPEIDAMHGHDPSPKVEPQAAVASALRVVPPAHPSPATPVGKMSQATTLVLLADETEIDLFHTSRGVAYGRVRVGEHWEVLSLRARPFRRWLQRLHHEATGKAAGSQAVADATGVLEGRALFDGAERDVHVRVAQFGDRIYLDLANANWRAVEIGPEGWRVVDDPPVLFRRASGAQPLPIPAAGGSVDLLRRFVNVEDDSWPVLAATLLAALRPSGPYPVVVLVGSQGSAKSTTARILTGTVDPKVAALRSEPREVRDLMIAATNGWYLGIDNLSTLPAWLSDTLCRLSTGGGFGTRELYTDDGEVLFDAMRPVVLTGIEEFVTRGDLLDRAVIVNLPEIPEGHRRPEAALWAQFEALRPLILGALLDAASVALANIDGVRLERVPRMADFALWAAAGEPGLGLPRGAFMASYDANRRAAHDVAIESSPVAQAALEFVVPDRPWTGSVGDLLEALDGCVTEGIRRTRQWPKSSRGLSDALRRLSPNLAAVGMIVTFGERVHGRRQVSLERRGDQPHPPHPPPPTAPGVGDGVVAVEGDDRLFTIPPPPGDGAVASTGSGGGDGGGRTLARSVQQADCVRCERYGPDHSGGHISEWPSGPPAVGLPHGDPNA